MTNVRKSFEWNLAFSMKPYFVATMIRLLNSEQKRKLLRIHVSGDYYAASYINAWTEILKATPHIRAWVYTRSWRHENLRLALEHQAHVAPNLRMWYSYDQETGYPDVKPKKVLTAYMQVAHDDIPKKKPDLYFRDDNCRKQVDKFIGGRFVCPVENGATKTQCEKCKVCFREESIPKEK